MRNVFVTSLTCFETIQRLNALPELWDKMGEIMQIIIYYGDQIRL